MKFKTYIGVMIHGADQGEIRYVTSTLRSLAQWEAGKPAIPFDERTAKEIVEGLTYNGWGALVVKAPSLLTLTNPKNAD